MTATLDHRIVRSHSELLAFVPEWHALFLSDTRSTPFQSPEWLLPWCESFASTSDLCCVVVRRGEVCVALLPFYLLDDTPTGECELHLLGVGTSDYLDGLFSPSCEVEDLLPALQLLSEELRWVSLHVNQLRPESLLLKALQCFEKKTSTSRLTRSGVYSSEPCSRLPAVTISDLPVKIRRNAMYYRNVAARRGSLTLSIAREESASRLFENFAALHTARWQSTGEPGVLVDHRVLTWHRKSVPLLAAANLLRLYVLQLDMQPIGLLYSLVDPDTHALRTQYIYLTAYDPAYRDLRPGTLLLALTIEAAAKEGVAQIDMLRGQEAYKQLWHVQSIPTFGLTAPRSALDRSHFHASESACQ